MQRIHKAISILAVLIALSVTQCCTGGETQPASVLDSSSQSGDDLAYQQNWPKPPDTTGMLTRLALVTLLVMAVCAGTLWFGRRWLRGTVVAAGGGRKLQVVESVSLGNRSVVHLLKVGEVQLVAGTDTTGLKSLVSLPQAFDGILRNQLQPENVLSVSDDVRPDELQHSLVSHAE